MWLPIIICLAAVALLLGPILLMQPTARQRREAALRQGAQQAGLRVHLQPTPRGADCRAPNCVAYCLPWEDGRLGRNAWMLVRRSYEHELHAAGRWDWQGDPAPEALAVLSPLLTSVPDSLFAVAAGPQGLCGYWLENGSDAEVERIAAWLHQSAARLRKSAARPSKSTARLGGRG